MGGRFAAVLSLAALVGCRSSEPVFHPVRAGDMREAGSVHLAVLAVAPWSEYVQALQPNFELTANDALKHVAKDSRWRTQDRLSARGVGVESALLEDASGARQANRAVPGILPPEGFGEQEALLGPPPSSEAPEVGPDSMLQYSAATALYQEVQLLNRYVRDAAIPAGFRPYMVRLQVSLMPSRRHAPYDAYTTLSFFIPGNRVVEGAGVPERVVSTTGDEIFERPFGNGPKVLPLLVTDNLEATVQANTFERAQILLLTLLNFPGSDFIEPMYSAMLQGALRDQVFGRDLNSLLTIARLSENTLRIRLGAMQEVTSNYAMVPRNHNVTMLLMVPEGAPSLMEVVSTTALVDAESGEVLDPVTEQDLVLTYARLQKEMGLGSLDLATLKVLHGFAHQNDQEAYSALLGKSLPAGHPVLGAERSLWIELVSLPVENQYITTLFELPGQEEDVQESSAVFQSQTVVAEDDGVSARIVLREARFPEFEQILAVLRLPEGEPQVVLPADVVELDLTRRELFLSFPSLIRWNLLPMDPDTLVLELQLNWAGQEQTFDVRHVELLE